MYVCGSFRSDNPLLRNAHDESAWILTRTLKGPTAAGSVHVLPAC